MFIAILLFLDFRTCLSFPHFHVLGRIRHLGKILLRLSLHKHIVVIFSVRRGNKLWLLQRPYNHPGTYYAPGWHKDEPHRYNMISCFYLAPMEKSKIKTIHYGWRYLFLRVLLCERLRSSMYLGRARTVERTSRWLSSMKIPKEPTETSDRRNVDAGTSVTGTARLCLISSPLAFCDFCMAMRTSLTISPLLNVIAKINSA